MKTMVKLIIALPMQEAGDNSLPCKGICTLAMAQDYARAVAKVAVAQTAESVGFEAVQQSASDTLSELLIRYISEIGGATHSYAELAGRTECNINDLVSLPPSCLISSRHEFYLHAALVSHSG